MLDADGPSKVRARPGRASRRSSGAAGKLTASSDEVTLNSSYCWESTKIGVIWESTKIGVIWESTKIGLIQDSDFFFWFALCWAVPLTRIPQQSPEMALHPPKGS